MTTILKGKTTDEANAIFENFHRVVTSGPATELSEDEMDELGKLSVFAGVAGLPGAGEVRVAGVAHRPQRDFGGEDGGGGTRFLRSRGTHPAFQATFPGGKEKSTAMF